jgi:hypothetical protein
MKNRLDKKQVKAWYFQSPHVEWLPFAESMGWDAFNTKSRFPVQEWVEEKKNRLSQAALEKLVDVLFGRESRYHQEVLRTLDEIPTLCDDLLGVIKKKISSISSAMETDPASVSTLEIMRLASALNVATIAKHKSLLLDRWTFTGLESFVVGSMPSQSDKSSEWVVQIMSKNGSPELLTAEQMTTEMQKWYDHPIRDAPT